MCGCVCVVVLGAGQATDLASFLLPAPNPLLYLLLMGWEGMVSLPPLLLGPPTMILYEEIS